jgi:hypothetical protein
MTLTAEIEKIKESIKQIEDPAAAMAVRHICKALEEIREEVTPASRERERPGQRPQ